MKKHKRTRFIPLEIEALRAEYQESQALQLQFRSVDTYLGFCQGMFREELMRSSNKHLVATLCPVLGRIISDRDNGDNAETTSKFSAPDVKASASEDLVYDPIRHCNIPRGQGSAEIRQQIARNEREIKRVKSLNVGGGTVEPL